MQTIYDAAMEAAMLERLKNGEEMVGDGPIQILLLQEDDIKNIKPFTEGDPSWKPKLQADLTCTPGTDPPWEFRGDQPHIGGDCLKKEMP